MKIRNILSLALLLSLGFTAQGCSDNDEPSVVTRLTGAGSYLTVMRDYVELSELNYSIGKNSTIIGINTDGEWTAESSDTSWCKLAVHAGYGYADSLRNSYTRIDVTKNEGEARTAQIVFKSGSISKTVTVNQKGMGVSAGDPFESAFTFVENLVFGYNLGNTLDSNPYDPTHRWWNPVGKTPVEWEMAWGQPETTQEIIDAIATKGFNVIRVPVTWYPHMDENDNVEEEWMNRVQQVVDMVLHAGCYCVLNVQHDSGSGIVSVNGSNVTRKDGGAWLVADLGNYETITAKFQKLWQQIATRFRDYDDKLLFEAFNEILDANFEWGDPADASAYTAINMLTQDFVNTVRATGGNNEYRNLVINPYSAGNSPAKLAGVAVPDDKHPNHLLGSVHSYDPYSFCCDNGQWNIYVFDTACQQEIDDIVSRVADTYSDLGIPVFFGEFGAIDENKDMGERIKYASYMARQLKAHELSGLWWMGLLDRKTLTWTESEIVDALFGFSESRVQKR